MTRDWQPKEKRLNLSIIKTCQEENNSDLLLKCHVLKAAVNFI